VVSPVYLFTGIVSYPFVRWALRLRAYGTEHIPREGGFVLSANHVSNFDPWPLGMPLWPQRQLRFMAKVELFRSPLWPISRGPARSRSTAARATRRRCAPRSSSRRGAKWS